MKKTVSDDKHTPGPWYVDIDRAICAASLAKGMWRGVVAEVALPTHERGNQEREANAALIASAPTLKAENERLREALDNLLDASHRGMYRARELSEAVKDAEALLASITGEHLTSKGLEARAMRRYRERLEARIALERAEAESGRLRAALARIVDGAPAQRPEYLYTDNHGDTYENAVAAEHYRLAEIALEALRGKVAS